MKRAILTSVVAMVIMAMLASLVMATVGPWQAEEVGNNPLLEELGGILNFQHQNGLLIRWHNDAGYTGANAYKGRDITWYRPASEREASGEMKNVAYVLATWDGPVWDSSKPFATAKSLYVSKLSSWIMGWYFTKLASSNNPSMSLQYEDKWIYMSNDYLYWLWFLGEVQKVGFGSGLTQTVVDAAAETSLEVTSFWPNGAYYKYSNVDL